MAERVIFGGVSAKVDKPVSDEELAKRAAKREKIRKQKQAARGGK